jgi:nucleoside-diphosphate-sugar epimerase
VLVTGSEGYIGSVLVPALIAAGHDVCGLDIGYFADGSLTGAAPQTHPVLAIDVREVAAAQVAGFDAVVHLAALSNDALGQLDESLTYEVNLHATVRLARLSKAMGVRRFVFSSSCSLYGQGTGALSEAHPANPQTAYGRSKVLAEESLSRLAGQGFSPVYLRNGTACGVSPRMRFDLVVNNLTGSAHTTGQVRVQGDGRPWRPLAHVRDIAAAVVQVLAADTSAVHDQAFNVGGENLRVRDIAAVVQRDYPGSSLSIAKAFDADTRDYQVTFEKARSRLGFTPSVTVEQAVREMHAKFTDVALALETFGDARYTRLRRIEDLRKAGTIDDRLRVVATARRPA